MRADVKAVAWDFDGVLNRNIIEGRFVWADCLEADLGIPLDDFQSGIFNSSFVHVITGKTDLLDHVRTWLDRRDYRVSAETVLDYWFEKDDLKDPGTCHLLERLKDLGLRQVIATNNENRLASYIENRTGFSSLVSHVFSSGRIGHAKPDKAFFEHISQTLDLPPQSLLLIDDSAANVRAAQDLGWQGFHFSGTTRGELASFLGF